MLTLHADLCVLHTGHLTFLPVLVSPVSHVRRLCSLPRGGEHGAEAQEWSAFPLCSSATYSVTLLTSGDKIIELQKVSARHHNGILSVNRNPVTWASHGHS